MVNITTNQLINGRGNAVNNQIVTTINEDGLITEIFTSYGEKICKHTHDGKVYLSEKWDFSTTTSKHLCIFLRRFSLPVYSRKDVISMINSGRFQVATEI